MSAGNEKARAWTSGPWYYEKNHTKQCVVRGPSRNRNRAPARIAVLGSSYIYESPAQIEDEANARLIAAAPELYEAALTALAHIGSYGDYASAAYNELEAALSSATRDMAQEAAQVNDRG